MAEEIILKFKADQASLDASFEQLEKTADKSIKDIEQTGVKITPIVDTTEVKKASKEIKAEAKTMSESFDNVGKSIGEITSGNVSGGFKNLIASFKDLTKSALSFVATPIGAAVTAIAGIGLAAKGIVDFNLSIKESNKLLKAFGLSGSELSNVRSEIQSTADTFGKSFDEVADKTNRLAKAYGISFSEANDIIAKGLATGGASNEEFLQSIGEYSVFFKKAGFSATEFTNILNKGFDLGIYSDKLPDAIKEATLSLTEQTTASKDALTNAFGATFTSDLLGRINQGKTSVSDGLKEIALQAEKTGLSQQQAAQLTADVFRGAGEDAGGALNVLKAIGDASTKQLTESEKATLRLVESQESLNKAQSELLEIENFGSIWSDIQIFANEALVSIINYVIELRDNLKPLIEVVGAGLSIAWESAKNAFSVFFSVIKGGLEVISLSIKTAINFWSSLLTGDFRGALNALSGYFTGLKNIVKNTFGEILNSTISTIQAILKAIEPFASKFGLDTAKLSKGLEGYKVEITKTNKQIAAETNKTDREIANNRISSNKSANSSILKDNKDTQKKISDEALKENERYLKEKDAIEERYAIARAKSLNDKIKEAQKGLKPVEVPLTISDEDIPDFDLPDYLLEGIKEDKRQKEFEKTKVQLNELLGFAQNGLLLQIGINPQDVERVKSSLTNVLDTFKATENTINEDSEAGYNARLQRIQATTELIAGGLTTISNALFAADTQKRQEELSALQVRQEEELRLAGDNEQKKDIIRQKYALKERELKRKQAEADKRKAIFDAIVGTSVAVIQAGVITPAAIIAAALGAAQIALIAAQPIPKFAKGGQVTDGLLKGKPHSSGGIILEAEGNEYITNKKQSMSNLGLLEAINSSDEARDKYINSHYVLPAIKKLESNESKGQELRQIDYENNLIARISSSTLKSIHKEQRNTTEAVRKLYSRDYSW